MSAKGEDGSLFWLWSRITDEDSATAAAKAGVIGGLIVAGKLLFTAMIIRTTDGAGMVPAEFASTTSSFMIFLAVCASLLTWRVWQAKGHFSAILLLLMAAQEIVVAPFSGGFGIRLLVDAIAILALVESIRGHRALIRFRSA